MATTGPAPKSHLTREVMALTGNKPTASPVYKRRRDVGRGAAGSWTLSAISPSQPFMIRWSRSPALRSGTDAPPAADHTVPADLPILPESQSTTSRQHHSFLSTNIQMSNPLGTMTAESAALNGDYELSPTYDAHLTDPDWTSHETAYLMRLVEECDVKWPVVHDRYQYEAPLSQSDDPIQTSLAKERSMESLKARYYDVSARLLSLHTPISSMDSTQWSLYETLTKFDPAQETNRKKLAEGHLYRRQQEVDEESVLLGELQRIMVNQHALEEERQDIRNRLDYPHGASTAAGTQYNTSQALSTLYSQLMAADKMKKDRRLRGIGEQASINGNAVTANPRAQRDSLTGPPDSSTSAAGRRAPPGRESLQAHSTLPVDLSKADTLRFGISTHDKLPSGVSFASDRITKARTAKSTIQTEKITTILQHIGIPDLIVMPTRPVVDALEHLMTRLHLLLEIRKVGEKEEQEIRIRQDIG